MLVEAFCKHCEKYYFFEDGQDHSLTETIGVSVKRFCPACTDPNYIVGESYLKDTVLSAFARYYYIQHDIKLSRDSSLATLKNYPVAWEKFNEIKYRTVTIPSGMCFGEHFILGPMIRGKKNFQNKRLIVCTRCNRRVKHEVWQVIVLWLGLQPKLCKNCDMVKGVNRDPDSDTSMARKLNVSLSDYRRYRMTDRIEPLPIGTKVGLLEIKKAYWDEYSFTPKYVVACTVCNREFVCIQKQVRNLEHEH